MPVIGIDLGTTYSAAARYLGDGETEIIMLNGNPTLPSVVGVRRNGTIVVGPTAKRNQARNPQDTVVEVKRKMGSGESVKLGQKAFPAPEISAMLLKHIVQQVEADLGEEVTGAVISCPAYFKEPQRQAIKDAAQIAGIKLLNIINEPTAAAYAYGVSINPSSEKSLFLVYDLGGGTFDVTVIRMAAGTLTVIGTGGDPELGGGNFDDRIVEWMLEKLAEKAVDLTSLTPEKHQTLRMRLKAHAEEAKIRLCGPPAQDEYTFQIAQVARVDRKPVVFNETLTRVEFERRIADLLDNSLRWVDEAFKVPKEEHGYTEDDITEILLVGGSTRVPAVRALLEQRFPGTPIRGVESGINPDEVVARGASIYAAENDPDSFEIAETQLIDVTGHTLSVEVRDEDGVDRLSPLIAKETRIPTKFDHVFAAGPMQRAARIKIYQGEGRELDLSQVAMIGEFTIMIDPINEPTPLKIGLSIDLDGILTARAENQLSGRAESCQINYDGGQRLSPAEVEQRAARFESTMTGVVGATTNVLDNEQPPAAQAAGFAPSGFTTAPVDPKLAMHPMMRALYSRALNEFDRVPADRQGQLMAVVSLIDQAAASGDSQRVNSHFHSLQQLMAGV